MNDSALAGVGVLITRPRHQAAELVDAITAAGGSPVLFPVLDIVPHDASSIADAQKELQLPDIAIFVSPNAVRFGLEYAAADRVAVVGPATAAAIESAGRDVDIRSPSGFDSEHLLATEPLQDVAGKVIRIIRGQAGRELLAETLRGRGAIVEYLSVYERIRPDYPVAVIDALEQQWRSDAIHAVTVMSVESFDNLVALLPEWCRSRLRKTPLVTPATRVIKEALKRFPGIPTTLAQGPSASDMVAAIIACTKT